MLKPINVTCKCSVPNRPPLRIESEVAEIIRKQLDGCVNPYAVAATWRCHRCKAKVVLTLRDIYLAST